MKQKIRTTLLEQAYIPNLKDWVLRSEGRAITQLFTQADEFYQ